MLANHKGESVLDRATVEPGSPGEEFTEQYDTDNSLHLSKRKRLSGKVKAFMHVSNDQLNVASNTDTIVLAANPDVTSGDARLDETEPPIPGPQGFQQLVQHPVDTIKAKTQRKTNKEAAANLLSPEVTHAQDVELVHAQDTLTNAQTDSERLRACEDLETLKKARQDLFVRWTMDRHVLKLKRLEDRTSQEGKSKESDSESHLKLRELSWKSYSQQVRLI